MGNIYKYTSIILLLIFFNAPGSCYAAATGNAVLKGRVYDAAGKPVKGAEIFIYSSDNTRRPADYISYRTGVKGLYSVKALPGTYWAVARLRGGKKYGPLMAGDKHSGEAVEVELAAGREQEMDFTVYDLFEAAKMMKKTDENIIVMRGKITDGSGIAAKGYYTFVNKRSGMPDVPDYISEWTDDSGRYAIYLPPGKYYLGYSSVFPPEKKKEAYRVVDLTADTTEIDIVIKKLPGKDR